MYFNTNMFAPLPTTLANDERADTLLTLNVADDFTTEEDRVKSITLLLLLSDPAAEGLPAAQRLQPVTVATIGHPGTFQNTPAAKGVESQIEVRINNIRLGSTRVEAGWLVFPVEPAQLAMGSNLVGVCVTERPSDLRDEIIIEKLELHVRYR
jgi:hypothetical protein